MDNKITILVVDDHPLVREGLKSLLDAFPNLSVIASAANGQQAVAACLSLKPDVVLMDVNLPDMSGLEAMRRIRLHDAGAKVLLLTSFPQGESVQHALDSGALGYLIKNAEISELVRAICAAAEGKHTLAPEAVKALIQSRPRPTPSGQELTGREQEVLALIVDGMTNQEIGREMSISPSTAKVYAAKVYRKLGVKSRAEAISKAISLQLIPRK